MSIEVKKSYKDDKVLRDSFNVLAEKVYHLNFEDWYQNGFWTEKYNPYSVIVDGKVVANVSVNQIPVMMNGERKHLIQLGTVMTDKEYRGQGFIRAIMKEIDQDWAEQCDGIYLFANDSVLEFYPKFGFYKADEYQYTKQVVNTEPRTITSVPMNDKNDWDKMEKIIKQSQAFYRLDMIDNSELYMFYLSQFMKNNVYYAENLNAYIVAEEENEELFIHAIFAEKNVSIDEVVKAFGDMVKSVTLGFAPDEKDGFECKLLREEDTTLFVKGAVFENFSDKKLMFTPISHA